MENWHKLVLELVCHLQVEGDVSLLRPWMGTVIAEMQM